MQSCKQKHTRFACLFLSEWFTSSREVENKRNNINFHHFIFDYVLLLVLLTVALNCRCCCYYFEFSFAFCVLTRWEKIHSHTHRHTLKATSLRRSNWICYDSYSVATFIRARNENYFFVPPRTLEMNRACVECVEMWRWRAYEKKHHKSATRSIHGVCSQYSNRLWQQQQKSGHIVCKCIAFRSQFMCLPELSVRVCVCLWVCKSERATVCWTVVYRNNVLLLCYRREEKKKQSGNKRQHTGRSHNSINFHFKRDFFFPLCLFIQPLLFNSCQIQDTFKSIKSFALAHCW